MAPKSEFGRKAFAAVVEASGVSEAVAVRVLAALDSSGLKDEAIKHAVYQFELSQQPTLKVAEDLQESVDKGASEVQPSADSPEQTSGDSEPAKANKE